MMSTNDEQTYSIIGAAMAVHRELGCGFLEAVYQEALAIEFSHLKIPFVKEQKLSVAYRGQKLATYYQADFVCHDAIIVELKAVGEFSGVHESQLINYLKASGLKRGLLINFGANSLQHKRMVYNYSP